MAVYGPVRHQNNIIWTEASYTHTHAYAYTYTYRDTHTYIQCIFCYRRYCMM
jgi:hypothetical protein